MVFADDDQADMLDAIGEYATVDGGGLYVVFHGQQSQIDYQGGGVIDIPPYVLASSADVSTLGITGGQDGTQLTVNGVTWTVLSVEPDGTGFVIMQLGTALP